MRNRATLPVHQLPALSFRSGARLSPTLQRAWSLLAAGDHRRAQSMARTLVSAPEGEAADRAAALVVAAAAEWRTGGTQAARRYAEQSIAALPTQWMAQRLLVEIDAAQQRYDDAYARLARLIVPPGLSPEWDEPLSHTDYQVALAGLAWRRGVWDEVAVHLVLAYPGGVGEMPLSLKQDWFQLALYRNLGDDALDAVEMMLDDLPIAAIDTMLQAMLQQGYTEQVRFMYATAYAASPDDELLRRRLVALHIKLGEFEEARRLAGNGALVLAA